MPEAIRKLNLVFQGGGVRGIAYAGALAKMPDYCQIEAVAGTSAGSIVASLLAIGKKPAELCTILQDPELLGFLDPGEVGRFERLQQAFGDAEELFADALAKGKLSIWSLWGFKNKHKDLADELGSVWSKRGLHQSIRLRTWLDRVLEGKTFEDIVVEDLKIVAADVSSRSYVVYDKRRNPTNLLAEAVHKSISIPIFFIPFTSGPNHFVDGGVLSNFPSYLFVKGRYPTIGFRLLDVSPSTQIANTLDYLKNLLLTMTEAHDKQRADPPYFRAYPIFTPANIPSTKFDLTNEQINELYQAGVSVGESVDWKKYSSPSPMISFYDPKPYEALELSHSNAYRLWEAHASPELWVDWLDQDTVLTVRIEKDWTIRYDGLAHTTVKGRKSLFVGRLLLKGRSNASNEEGTSIADVWHICEELTNTGAKQMIRIPAFNDDEVKGFVVLYVPPISEDSGTRILHTGFKVPQEFAQSVGKGHEDEITYTVRQRATEQYFRIRFRLLVDVELPALDFNCPTQLTQAGVEYDDESQRTYRLLECQIQQVKVTGEQTFRVICRMK